MQDTMFEYPNYCFLQLLHVVVLYEYDDSPHAATYLSIENEDLCKAWLTAQLRCAGHNVCIPRLLFFATTTCLFHLLYCTLFEYIDFANLHFIQKCTSNY